MALPKLNDTPKYSVKIPSTQMTVRYRPFLVKEEKVLLLAMESDDTNDIILAILDTISACVADNIDVNKLTTYDVEYLFTQIRAKSVGETTNVNIECESCKEPNAVSIDINSINVEGLDGINYNVQLSPDMQLELKHPTYSDIFNDPTINGEDTTETLFAMIRHSMKNLKTEDEIINLENESAENLDEFIGSMNTEQFDQVRQFIDTVPVLQYDVEFDCKCGTHNKKELRGIQSFF
jgi:hypothetical protein|tara:strand:- start:1720 stop:2427 length:708 start_codon:yes stop_codon:yes gene_type:complete